MKLIKISIAFCMLVSTLSCTKDVDFNQVDDIDIHTSFISTLFYLDFYASDFLNTSNQEIHLQSDVVVASVKEGMKDYLEKIEFNIVTKNTFNRQFTLQVIFYDENMQPIYILKPNIVIPSNSNTKNTVITVPKEDISVIYSTIYFGFSMVLQPSTTGEIIKATDTYNLNIKSSATLYFNYKKV
ncbi:hypothetical protein [Lutibacter sp.]|uniref:hypothetical protein n=1 Tax=Lutibacter sp. TaxID=1925666 RepID=UPI0027361E66|nr:hypothetical protein [Lutibacter sp.]MDP3311829.1 hypothetical protein [Lutibacter sp.]